MLPPARKSVYDFRRTIGHRLRPGSRRHKAENLRVWDMRGVSSLTDYMVVCSGTSVPHLKAILRDIGKLVHDRHGVKPMNAEGTNRHSQRQIGYDETSTSHKYP